MAESSYILSTDREELQRLAFQHRAWALETADLWRRAGFSRGQQVLDLGSGPGLATVDLAHLVGPEGSVLAIDGSPGFLEDLQRHAELLGLTNVETQCRDVHELELADRSLDGAFARWLFCFVQDPQGVVRSVAKALRTGAPLAAFDYFNYRAFTIAPRRPEFDRIVKAVEDHFRRRGSDLEVLGRLPALLEASGLEVLEVRCHARVARPGEPLWQWPQDFFHTFLPRLVEAGEVSAGEAKAFDEIWDSAAEVPGSYLCLPPMFDVVAVKR